jgi:hypothetical protein
MSNVHDVTRRAGSRASSEPGGYAGPGVEPDEDFNAISELFADAVSGFEGPDHLLAGTLVALIDDFEVLRAAVVDSGGHLDLDRVEGIDLGGVLHRWSWRAKAALKFEEILRRRAFRARR